VVHKRSVVALEKVPCRDGTRDGIPFGLCSCEANLATSANLLGNLRTQSWSAYDEAWWETPALLAELAAARGEAEDASLSES
jgi:hypothetical protein